MKYQFIDDQRAHYPVVRLCAALDVARSGYYSWRTRPVSPRKMANQRLLAAIKEVYTEVEGSYGSPRIYKELQDRLPCSENRVARLMRRQGIVAKQARRSKRTTRANAAHLVAPNLLQRDFSAERPNEKWLADITYIRTGEGWLYLAAVLDLFSRRIVGWAMAARMTQELVSKALDMALRQRRPPPSLLHHADRGSQYTSGKYQKLLADNAIRSSMSGVGNCYDNAPMESFFGTLKTERVYYRAYRTRAEARADLFQYIEVFYNRCRRHSSVGYLSPAAFEAAHYEQLPLTLCP